ncbi:MAG: ABC transporter ATP-binding protein/permease [bacterium]|nr:ABC transporter ATP-binding protein/permease [bacterium]
MRKIKNIFKKFLVELGYDDNVASFVRKLKPPWRYILGVAVFTLFFNATTIVQPIILAKLFEMIYEQRSIYILNFIVLFGLILFFVRGVSQYFQGYLLAKASQEALNQKRREFIETIFKQPVYILEKNHSGHLISVVISNIASIVSDIPGLILGYINSIITLVFSIGWIFYKDITLGFMTVFTLPFLAFVMRYFFRKLENVSELIQQKISKVITDMNEVFRYIKIVKSFNREEFEKEKIFSLLDEYKNLSLKLSRVSFLQKPTAEFIASLSLIAITWYSGYLVISGVLKPFDVLAYWGYVAISVAPITNLSASIFNTRVIIGYIKQFMNTASKLNENEYDPKLYEYNNFFMFKGKVVFENVSFAYDDKVILNNISFTIKPGEKIGIIGKSGIGKSTLVSLLMKFYKPIGGKIYIDDIEIDKINPVVVRDNISILTQEIYLFSDTILNNVRYSNIRASEEEIFEACKKAGIHEDILSKKESYNYSIMEDGKGLSGGQRQRIALSRIFLKTSSIVILDEPTSSLDPTTSKQIIDSVFSYFKDKTVIIISHNYEISNLLDRIFVLEDGRIVEIDNKNKQENLFFS